jgi:hypothetical protein
MASRDTKTNAFQEESVGFKATIGLNNKTKWCLRVPRECRLNFCKANITIGNMRENTIKTDGRKLLLGALKLVGISRRIILLLLLLLLIIIIIIIIIIIMYYYYYNKIPAESVMRLSDRKSINNIYRDVSRDWIAYGYQKYVYSVHTWRIWNSFSRSEML